MRTLHDKSDESVHILVVEDSPTQAEHLKHVLARKQYRFTSARNGCEALSAVTEERPALIISDIVMPEMDGYELCRRLKLDENTRSIPVILLTSLNDPVDVVKGLECGADNFVFKPYDENYLLSRISSVLTNQHLRQFEHTHMGVEVYFAGRRFFITSDRLQILNLLLSTYETAVVRNKELATARDQLRYLNDTLEHKVRERTTALQQEVAERVRAETEVRRLNTELDQRVRQRTAELERANEELEAFSYSVSHDLRTPLRHLSGYAGLLHRSIADKLDPTTDRYLKQISDATSRMSNLIDNLLEFSRMGRVEIRKTEVALGALVRETIGELEFDAKGRRIVWTIEPLPTVCADATLLRQVLSNLLANAVKYTRPREVAEVTIGAKERTDDVMIFVRDNGVGFDMKYAAKLFGVFQRLHGADEFEGTGVGLANVRRIIARHGGQTWAEATPGEGASFFFTLPVHNESCPPL